MCNGDFEWFSLQTFINSGAWVIKETERETQLQSIISSYVNAYEPLKSCF